MHVSHGKFSTRDDESRGSDLSMSTQKHIAEYLEFVVEYPEAVTEYSELVVEHAEAIIEYLEAMVEYLEFVIKHPKAIVKYLVEVESARKDAATTWQSTKEPRRGSELS